ncbi:MAG TPA: hypothetical protein VK666_24790 [Chryseolinea sp.]|nr:hypothetical protein [Chryseolinea sp.]
MKKKKLTTLLLGAIVGVLTLYVVSCSDEEFRPDLTREFSIQSAFKFFTGRMYSYQ